MEELRRQFAALQATVQAGFLSSERRIDDLRAEIKSDMADKHEENKERLERIEEKQDLTNGNVIKHEAEIRHITDQLKFLWKRPKGEGDSGVSRDDLKTLLALVLGTASITAAIVLWVLKIAGKL